MTIESFTEATKRFQKGSHVGMATEDPVRLTAASVMRTGLGMGDNIRTSGGGGLSPSSAHEGVAQELGMLLRSHSRLDSILHRRDMGPHRSGSAPPSVEGSLASMGGLFTSGVESGSRLTSAGSGDGIDMIDSEQELRSDPAYLAYYYSHVNLNPRLPPPLLSREKYLLSKGLAAGDFGDNKRKLRSFDDTNSRSLFSSQPVLPTHNEEPECFEDEKSPMGSLLRQVSDRWAEKGADEMLGSSSYGFGARPKSLVDLIQEDFPRTPSPVYNQSRSSSRAANEDGIDGASGLDVQLTHLRDSSISAAAVAELTAALLGSRSATPNAVLPSRSTTPGAVLTSRSATPNPGISSRSGTPNPTVVHMIGSNSAVAPSSSSVSIARVPTPVPSNANEAFADDMPVLSTGSNTVNTQSRSGSLDASSSAAGAELAAALKVLSLSDVHGTGSFDEQQEQLHPPVESQQQLQQETGGQHHSLRQQQSQRHSQHSHSTQAHSQTSEPPAFTQVFHRQQQLSGLEQSHRAQAKYGLPNLVSQSQNTTLQPGAANNIYAAAAAAAAMSYMAAGNPYYQNMQAANIYAPHYGLGGYAMNPALIPGMMASYPSPVAYDTTAAAAAAAAAAAVAAGMGARVPVSGSTGGLGIDMQQLYKYAGQAGTPLQSHLPDPLYFHYLQQHSAEDGRAALNLNDHSLLRGYVTGSHIDPLDLQKTQLSSMLGYPSEQKTQFPRSNSIGVPIGNKSGSVSPVYYGSPPGVGFVMPYANSPISSPVLPGSPVVPGALSLRQTERNYRLSSGAGRTTSGGAYGPWQGQRVNDAGEELKGSSLLEELKNNKTRRIELADITGHVVEFSADQHGSRLIQQKLETVSSEEKALVFQEVLPQALTLMTDVFGNYVIQKFFEHGSPQQRSELANRLVGHVLTLSLQMYGCRVIQKALEVVDTEQQTSLVSELDGHVMRCVHDQNGNHVIQKCIECVPPEHVQFIISSFYGQVVKLSTHSYGCRVIQRVLEHCTDEQKQNGIMEEILRSACTLAQDQYGNYVVQHVLEHGKPHEKSEILTKLAGQIVQMSQHKFASNVVEKCLEFGGPAERDILIGEMLGHNDENEPLQAMMKDQYANYVVQKVLETCDDLQRELLLSRIRVHLHALKKYTYGKHIVARVEKLLAAGERRGAQLSST